MERIRSKLQELESESHSTSKLQVQLERLTGENLKRSGLANITLRPYQLEGVRWLLQRWERKHGAILGDEMGLGKTCQTIAFITYLFGTLQNQGPYLVICPLSVINNWREEFQRFSPGMKVMSYLGGKDERADLQQRMSRSFHVVITTYEICMNDADFLQKFTWSMLVVDEAHRLKNSNSVLYQTLKEMNIHHHLLLTGTPIQNNMIELYSLLSFIAPKIFRRSQCDSFVNDCSKLTQSSMVNKLHDILKPFILRRTKGEVVLDLPKKSEVLLFHGLSALQKQMYKAILTHDTDLFRQFQASSSSAPTKTSLMNVMMQLRKCVNHPYMFNGVEPEPFELGDHLINVSGKLHLLDQLLQFLKENDHKVLLFSQMTYMLDILQDYLGYRGYNYERLDGSVRGEERFLAVRNFNENDETFVFLLSTRAGGQGLNLVSADTVIFVDSDFNPQNDLQAAARAHRIGQTKPVKIIRLVGKDTVEEVILRRADIKLKLTNTVIEGGQFSSVQNANSLAENATQLSDMLKFGVEKLLESEDSSLKDINLLNILGETINGEWAFHETSQKVNEGKKNTKQTAEKTAKNENDVEDVVAMETEEDADEGEETETQDHIYMFEGIDYSKETSAADKEAFDSLIAGAVKDEEEALSGPRSKRSVVSKNKVDSSPLLLPLPQKRKILTEEEKAERKRKREENAAKKAKLMEEAEVRRAQEWKRKLEEEWQRKGYKSRNIPLDSEGEEEEEEDSVPDFLVSDEDDVERKPIHYVKGDVTYPNVKNEDAIVVHCVDDSGGWGKGGLFTALSSRSSLPETHYEEAGEMQDLALGDAHLVTLDDKTSREDGNDFVALIVAQHRNRKKNRSVSGIKLAALEQGLKRIYKVAKEKKASVHLPRIGHATPGFNWYGTERLIKKHLTNKGIDAYVYYFSKERKNSNQAKRSSDPAPFVSALSQQFSGLDDFLTGVKACFHGDLSSNEKNKLRRFIIAYNGDVVELASGDASHVIVPDSFNQSKVPGVDSATKIVTSKWIWRSVAKQRKLPEEWFLPKGTTNESEEPSGIEVNAGAVSHEETA